MLKEMYSTKVSSNCFCFALLFTAIAFFPASTFAQAPGNVAVGNNSPQEKLHVSGGFIRSDTLAGTGNAYMVVDQDGNLAFRIDQNGQATYVLTGAGTLVDISSIVPVAFDKYVDSIQVVAPIAPSNVYSIELILSDGSSSSFTIDVGDNDNDATNEIQSISMSGTTLVISGSNSVDLSVLQDGTGTDDQQLSISG